MAVCLHCHVILESMHHEYHAMDLNPDLVTSLEEWCGCEVTETDNLCESCVNLLVLEATNRNLRSNQSQVNTQHQCIACGISLDRRSGRRCRTLLEGSNERIYIANLIFPRQIPNIAYSCNPCWMRAYHNAPRLENIEQNLNMEQNQQNIEQHVEAVPEVVNEPPNSVPASSSITVPSSETESWVDQVPNVQDHVAATDCIDLFTYSRTSDTATHCFVPECTNTDRLRVPSYLRRTILKNHKVFITTSARVCNEHLVLYNWDILNNFDFIQTFSRVHIEQMLNLLSTTSSSSVLNFENIENSQETLCQFWTGLTVTNFLLLFNNIPQLGLIFNKAKTDLGLYLIRLRTGESFARLASLFLLSKTSVIRYVSKTRECINTHYVPMHLGIGHLSRDQLSARNLLIPQGIFGTPDNNPIVICDGTYIYLQKSSNYLFQKKTYSLHKYHNLVKPFLMVTCDGHIIDAFGPYAATQSDADIMKHLFENENSPLRAYFRQNDIFILDRGFRDAIGLLTSLGYSIYKPESLNTGERQLSTLNANKSRLVTLCRWVVEIVNGRFKRDFKIFRSNYFNNSSKHLITDFRIAAAILNQFHPVITDHPDAEAILTRALNRLNMPNTLADYIIAQNINRYRVNFVAIDGQLPHLDVFPVMEIRDLILFGLGIYQINGTFKVEVDTSLLEQTGSMFLLRGRIRSRHQSNKIYYTYILLNLNTGESDWCQRISEYYCSCIIGKRTVGSCAHVMTIVWYLGWARHQENISSPASFLDNILVREDIEIEEEE